MTKTNEKITVRFTIVFFGHKIIGTKASFNKAAKGYGPEYDELSAKMAAHPTFELVEKEQKHKSTRAKKTYDGLDFPFMRAYILTRPDSDILMKEYEEVKKVAKSSGTKTYPLTKKWFLGKFGTEEKPFDMDEAREAINAYRIQLAEKNAATALSVVSSGVPAQQDTEEAA